MWEAFAPLATNKTPAIGGSAYFSLSSTHGSSQPRRSNNRASTPSSQWASGSSQNPVVLPVRDTDPFSRNYNSWPASQADWSDVYTVTSGFRNTDDPFLWTPLLTQEERSRAFRENRNRCLNCSGEDHSMKHCVLPFKNTSGLLNAELGNLNDDSAAFRRWQGRMRSYRRKSSDGRHDSQGRRNQRSSSSSQRRNHTGNHGGASPRNHQSQAHNTIIATTPETAITTMHNRHLATPITLVLCPSTTLNMLKPVPHLV